MLGQKTGYDAQVLGWFFFPDGLNDLLAVLLEILLESRDELLPELVAGAFGAAKRVSVVTWLKPIRFPFGC